jgi:cytochrome c553
MDSRPVFSRAKAMRIARNLAAVTCLLAGALLQSASAGDALAGRAKAQALCANCHGEDGVAVLPGAANLSGQQKEYLREQLRAFRAGSRHNPQMSVVAKTLSDAQIEDLAEWYASIRITVEKP